LVVAISLAFLVDLALVVAACVLALAEFRGSNFGRIWWCLIALGGRATLASGRLSGGVVFRLVPRRISIDFADWTELEPAGRLVFIKLAIFGGGGFRRRVISLAAAVATRK